MIEKLFVTDPKKRLGFNSADEVKNHPFFKDIDFNKVLNKEYKPPFVPKLDSDTDLKYFDKIEGIGIEVGKSEKKEDKELGENLEIKEDESDDLHFEGFSYETNDGLQNEDGKI